MFPILVQKLIANLTGVDRLSGVATAGFATITNGKMWRSVGWLLLGVLLMILGLFWLIRTVRGDSAPSVGQAADLAALAA